MVSGGVGNVRTKILLQKTLEGSGNKSNLKAVPDITTSTIVVQTSAYDSFDLVPAVITLPFWLVEKVNEIVHWREPLSALLKNNLWIRGSTRRRRPHRHLPHQDHDTRGAATIHSVVQGRLNGPVSD